MRTLFIVTLVLFFTSIHAQNFECSKDIDFIIHRYTKDYSGFKDFAEKNPGFERFLDSARSASYNQHSIQGCDAIIRSIVRYFNNKHVFYGSTVNNPDFKEETQESSMDHSIIISFPSKRSVYVKIGSSNLQLKDTLEKILISNEKKIRSSAHLIIDVRGNGGGSDAVLNSLLPYLYTNPILSYNLELWSSENNIKLFEDLLQNQYIAETDKETIKSIVEKAKSRPNQFISINGQAADTIRFSSVMKRPKNISILIDGKCMSATENFLLLAKQSRKVKIYGNSPTAGGVDYGDLNFVTLPSGYWYISVPTTRSARLPLQVVDNIGISPDVLVEQGKDPLQYVLELRN